MLFYTKEHKLAHAHVYTHTHVLTALTNCAHAG